MNLTNYHSHTLFCDGRANMEDFIRFAIGQGFTSYGFTSHAPLPFSTAWTMEWDRMDDYIAEFRRMKEKYSGEIELYLGLEIDYLNAESNPSARCFQELPLDYRIGSVHLLYDDEGNIVDIDSSPDVYRKRVDEHFHGDIQRVVRLYFDKLRCMADRGGFDVLGHGDKMHYNALCYAPGLLDEPWYDTLIHEYWTYIAEKNYIVEVNTKSYEDTRTFFPNQRYFSFLHDLGVKVQVNSDAHYPERINAGRYEALVALKNAGFRTVVERHQDKWVEISIYLE